ncbi:MAG: thioredoxin family protein [Bacteroidota bacterium]|nr:thioredoxin family protein [Bacteroidota bacterium]
MRKIILPVMMLIVFCAFSLNAQEREKFDPKKDPSKDLKTAVKIASKENKNILLDVGGEWCPWCHRLDEFILGDKEINNYMHSNFVVVKVNWSPENKNEKFLSQYPKVPGYPHLFVLDKKGKLIHSQDTGALEQEKSYSKDKLMSFLQKYSVKKK